MKSINSLLVCLLALSVLSACGVRPKGEPMVGGTGTTSTEGGGGTITFSFLAGASVAHKTLEATEALEELPADSEIELFYSKNRRDWMSALARVQTEPNLIKEVPEQFSENGRRIGGRVIRTGDKVVIELSQPYLNAAEGFTSQKAFALALHEAGHIAVPNLTQEEHGYLDLIGALLTAKMERLVSENQPLTIRVGFRTNSLVVTSDLRRMALIHPEGISTYDLFTGKVLEEPTLKGCASMGEDYFYCRRGETTLVRNVRTGKETSIPYARTYSPCHHLEDNCAALVGEDPEGKKDMLYIFDKGTRNYEIPQAIAHSVGEGRKFTREFKFAGENIILLEQLDWDKKLFKVWDLVSRKDLGDFSEVSSVYAQFSPDLKYFWTGRKLVSLKGGVVPLRLDFAGQESGFKMASFSPDNKWLALGTNDIDAPVRIFDLATAAIVREEMYIRTWHVAFSNRDPGNVFVVASKGSVPGSWVGGYKAAINLNVTDKHQDRQMSLRDEFGPMGSVFTFRNGTPVALAFTTVNEQANLYQVITNRLLFPK